MVLHECIILLSLWVNEKQNRATCVTGADYTYYHRESPCQPQVQEVEPLKHDFLMSAIYQPEWLLVLIATKTNYFGC